MLLTHLIRSMSENNMALSEMPKPDRVKIIITVNGEKITEEVSPRLKLSDFLRNTCELNGVRVGCEHGVCGVCAVTMDGNLMKSCLSYAVQADGSVIETVDGLAEDGSLHPVQQAFHESHALQCGFCTSGFVMATKNLLDENIDPSPEEIEAALAGNLCRCTGYKNIFKAVDRAVELMEE